MPDAAALRGKLLEDFIRISIYCIVSARRGLCSVTKLFYEGCINPLLPGSTRSPPLVQAAEHFGGA